MEEKSFTYSWRNSDLDIIFAIYISFQDTRVGTSLSSTPLQPTRRDDVANGCTKPTRCTEQCPAITSVCQIGWEESKCVCNEGRSILVPVSFITLCIQTFLCHCYSLVAIVVAILRHNTC